ncbi:Gibberellin 3-beta-dioxygenase 1 [Spatholobus suberectus]|nr:Gibberellin 3-beta-dioxygenase 1 [Spatholobus suberectus]
MDSISNAYKSSPNHLNHLLPLDFNSVLTVPDSHKWVDVEPHAFGSVPLVDLSDTNAKLLIREACEKWGAFQVINHWRSLEPLERSRTSSISIIFLTDSPETLRSPVT